MTTYTMRPNGRGLLEYIVDDPNELDYESRYVEFIRDKESHRTSCSCPQFQKLAKIKDRTIATYNCKHVVFVMRKLGFDKGDPMLAANVMSDNDIVKLKEACLEWIQKPSSSTSQSQLSQHLPPHSQHLQQIQVPTYSSHQSLAPRNTTLKKITKDYATRELAVAGLRGLNRQSRWYACRYVREPNKRGAPHQCTTENGSADPHRMIKGNLCLKVEFEHFTGTQNPGTPYLLKTLVKYFCMNPKCFTDPRKKMCYNSNFNKPSFTSLDTTQLNDLDRREVENCFNCASHQ